MDKSIPRRWERLRDVTSLAVHLYLTTRNQECLDALVDVMRIAGALHRDISVNARKGSGS